jgi:hypothetical protein
MRDQHPDPWTCDECGHVNAPDSPVCRCYFWDDEPTRERDEWEARHLDTDEEYNAREGGNVFDNTIDQMRWHLATPVGRLLMEWEKEQ